MIKKSSIISFMAAGIMACAVSACGGGKEAETLMRQAERVNSELATTARQDPALFAKAGAEYADSAFSINIVFAD